MIWPGAGDDSVVVAGSVWANHASINVPKEGVGRGGSGVG